MIIEVPSNYLNNLFFFYKIFELAKKYNKEDIVLYINTINDNVNFDKLTFCVSALKELNIETKIIIDTKMPNYYLNVLLLSKLNNGINIERDVSFNDAWYLIQQDLILRLGYKINLFSKETNEYESYSNLDLNIDSINQITKINSSNSNIDILKKIVNLFKNTNKDYKNNYMMLKKDLIDIFYNIKLCKIDDISSLINLFEELNKEVNFRR